MMMMVARIVGIEVMVAMMIAVVTMMIAVVTMMIAVVTMMIAVPRCGWDSAAGRDYSNDA